MVLKQNKTKKINKILLVSYIVLSAIFILLSFFTYLQNSVYNVGVQTGTNNTLNGVMNLATNPDCNTFSVSVGNNKVDLINIACLQQTSPEEK